MHTMRIYYRPDQYPDWALWREFSQKFFMIGKAGAIDSNGVPRLTMSSGEPSGATRCTGPDSGESRIQ